MWKLIEKIWKKMSGYKNVQKQPTNAAINAFQKMI
jgi:hypothetical protein